MTKIYTKTGDAGETGLFDGTRVAKSDARVEAYGAVDELNAWLGLLRATNVDAEIAAMLVQIQRDLHAVGAQLADPRHKIAARVEKAGVTPAAVVQLEQWIDTLERTLPPLRRFILAGGSTPGAFAHIARTVCRRAERRIVAIGPVGPTDGDPVQATLLTYVNRLSDLLFVIARAVNHRAGSPESEW
jgi:cob(I)alamin adenosyltransferase